jgi:hypothetical protein
MKFLTITILSFLLCSPGVALTEKREPHSVFYEFSQSDDRYTFNGSFFTISDPEALFHILYDFEHLTQFVTSADSITLLHQGRNWYEVRYVYRKLLLETKFTYRKTLIREKQKIIFELIACEQGDPTFPKILSSNGYYEILQEGKGFRVTYYEEVRMGSKLSNGVYSLIAKKGAVKFIQDLKKYVERQRN